LKAPADKSERQEDLSKDELLTLNQTLRAQVADLRERVATATEQAELARAGATAPASADASLRERIEALEMENRELLASAGDDGKRGLRRLRRENEKLEAALQEAAEKAELAKSLGKEIEALKGIAVELEANLAKMSEEKSQMRQELTAVLSERKKLGDKLAQLSDRLEALQKTAEDLRRQNEALRDQL
jgi:chromosome segregation ATPase